MPAGRTEGSGPRDGRPRATHRLIEFEDVVVGIVIDTYISRSAASSPCVPGAVSHSSCACLHQHSSSRLVHAESGAGAMPLPADSESNMNINIGACMPPSFN
jgi:hypothetical protein